MYLFRMTHLQNIPHILQHGITHKTSVHANPNYVPIGDNTLISSRNTFLETINNRFLGDYIPFYFGVRMPMLYMIQNGFYGVTQLPAQDIVYCVSNIETITSLGLEFIFTDGHAVDSFTTFYHSSNINTVSNIVDTSAIYARYWNEPTDMDLKRRKQAELLVLGDIPIAVNLGYVVYNESAKTHLIQFGVSEDTIQICPSYYF